LTALLDVDVSEATGIGWPVDVSTTALSAPPLPVPPPPLPFIEASSRA
jgi:hypothetical protein